MVKEISQASHLNRPWPVKKSLEKTNRAVPISHISRKTPEKHVTCYCWWNRPGYFLRSASLIAIQRFDASKKSVELTHVTESLKSC
jgi:hypothetical protein